MNDHLINAARTAYSIGDIVSRPKPCAGGLLHRCWQLETTKGQFIVKLLNPAIMNQPGSRDRYCITERIATNLKKQVRAITALLQNDSPLFSYQNDTIMIFPYLATVTLTQNEITSLHVAQIGRALSQIHYANIKMDDAPPAEMCSLEFLKGDIQKNLAMQCPEIAAQLDQCASVIKIIDEKCQYHESILKNNLVISHRDCDPKNVLWEKDGHYYIIDWESAGLINKTKDTVATAIYWSINHHDYQINLHHLATFLTAYLANHGMVDANEIEAGVYGLLGDWLAWLTFNLSRMLANPKNSDEFARGKIESKNTMTALPLVIKQLPNIMEAFKNNI